MPPPRSLDEQRNEFARRRFLAMPLAGTIAWTVAGVCGLFLPPRLAGIVLFAATGSIFYLALLLARFTGEDLLGRSRPKNAFDTLFLLAIAMALLVYAIAIPFYHQDPTSLPLTIGVLTGLMWLPFSWIIGHWIGIAHGIGRTLAIVAIWHLLPGQRLVAVPAVIVLIYAATIAVLESRWRRLAARDAAAAGFEVRRAAT
ncbi:MAG: hypothetical protein GXC76_01525 [Rhodanobacteraceae bacterium]|nr:hypothetical protein [Rhodanobacteraceae bacterium]